MKKLSSIAVVLCAIFLTVSASAQTHVRYVMPTDIGSKALYLDDVLPSVQLPQGVSRVDNNPFVQDAARELNNLLKDENVKLLRVYVCGSTSPDGLWQYNVNLSKARTDATVRYLRQATGIPYDKICSENLNEDWDRLYELVEQSDIPYREEILNIISTKKWGERKLALQKLGGGKVWRILIDEFFPQLRCVRIAFFCQWDEGKTYMVEPAPEPVIVEKPAPVIKSQVDTIYVRDTVYCIQETVVIPVAPAPVPEPAPEPVPVPEPTPEPVQVVELYTPEPVQVVEPEPVQLKGPWMMGFKTNLFGDGVLVPNLGVEFQLGKHVSLDIQGLYSQWNILNMADATTNIYGVTPELRLWTGKKAMRKGSFFGVHGRVVWYTLQGPDGLLYQNGPENVWEGNYLNAGNKTPAWALGLTYGYSIGFGRKGNWGLELTLGVGYANYKQNIAEFTGDAWQYIEHQDKHYLGITKVGVNLTYRFSLRKVDPKFYENEK